jgi:hypothetical protein
MDIQAEIDAITQRYYGAVSAETTKFALENDIRTLIYRLYAEGYFLIDRCGDPIHNPEDVGIAVSMGPYTLSAVTYRAKGDDRIIKEAKEAVERMRTER